MKIFDENCFKNRCSKFFDEASRGCGGNFELFQETVTCMIQGLIDNIADERDKENAIRIARDFCYLTPEELISTQKELEDMGLCPHYFEPDTCPLGCGDK